MARRQRASSSWGGARTVPHVLRQLAQLLPVLLALLAAVAAGVPSGVPSADEHPFYAKFDTSEGAFVIEINPSWAPLGAERFLHLVRTNYFDGQKVFRVIPNFLVQFGYNGDPDVTRRQAAQKIADDPFRVSNYRGYVAFAGSAKDSRSTHVFINLVDNFFIDHRDVWATPFARVITGMDVVESFYAGYQRMEKRGGPTPSQGRIATDGNAYLDRDFPKLSTITSVQLIRMPPPPGRAAAEEAAVAAAAAAAAAAKGERSAAKGERSAAAEAADRSSGSAAAAGARRRRPVGSSVPRRAGAAPGAGAVTLKPFPAHWANAPSLDPESREDVAEFPSGFGHGSRAAAKWIRLNERMDALAEEDRAQEARKQALLQGLPGVAAGRPAVAPVARRVRGGGGGDHAHAAAAASGRGSGGGGGGGGEPDLQRATSTVAAGVVVQKLGSELRAAEDEISHDSPVVLVLALIGAVALVWLVCTSLSKGRKAKQ